VAIVGIDLGTTNSLVAVWREGGARIIGNALGENLTPSVVGVDDDGQILVGQAARERLITHPERTVASFKRFMGTDRVSRLGNRSFRAEELSSFVLRSLRADAEAFLGEPVEEAVISVPAYFNDTQRKATRNAGKLAGLRVERLINEPTAAAVAYGLHEAKSESRFLVFDLGGGTFDVSALELFDGVMEVRASAGDNFLGGDDFTAALAAALLKRGDVADEALSAVDRSRVLKQAELAKRRLTNEPSVELKLALGERNLAWTVSREDLEGIARDLVERLRRPVERAMRDARLKVADLDDVVLVGGATRMPLVRAVAAKLFGRFPLANIDPDEVVALGAAVQAGLKARDRALGEVVLTDTCPYSLGVDSAVVDPAGRVVGHEFSPIIERNTVVPTSREKTFYPLADDQPEVRFAIFQGESRRLEHDIRLGTLTIPLPKGRVQENAIRVRFTYDINGLLEVDVLHERSSLRKTVVIEGNPGAMSAEEIKRRLEALEALKIHPREKLENRTVLARGERLFEESLGELREHVGRLLARFEAVLASQEAREIDKARVELSRELSRVEETPW
jgi:molecular chaperone HscC